MVGTLGCVGGAGGDIVAAAPVRFDGAATGIVSQLISNLSGTVTFSKLSGAAGVSVSSAGAVSLSSALGVGGTASFVARAANTTGDAVERTLTLTGAVVLGALSLSASSFSYGAASGTVIGTISGKTAGSVLSVVPDDGRVAITGSDGAGWSLVVGMATWMSGATVSYGLVETLASAANSGRSSAVSVTANAVGSYIFSTVPKLGLLGDSLLAHQVIGFNDIAKVKQNALGEFTNAIAQKPRILMEQWPYDTTTEDGSYTKKYTTGANRAVNSSTVAFAAGRVAGMAASNIDIFFYGPTINSAPETTSPETTIINNILEPMYAAGKFVVVTTMRPIAPGGLNDGTYYDGGSHVTGTYLGNRARINSAMATWAAAKPASRVLFINLDNVYDPDGDGYLDPAWTYDNTHLNPYGADKGAVYINQCLDTIIAPSVSLWAQQIALTNYQPNWNLTGTTGTKGSAKITGTVPTSWYCGVGGTGNSSVAVSVEANATTGGQNAVLTVTPNSADGTAYTGVTFASNGSTGNTAVAGLDGKYVRACVEVELDGNPAWGLPCVYFSDASSSTAYRRIDFDNIGNSACLPASGAAARSYYLMTDPLPMSAGTTGYKLSILFPINTVTASGTPVAKVKRVRVVECGDPVPRWNMS